MTKTQLICNVIVMALSFFVATLMLSNIVKGNNEHWKFKFVMWLILSLYSSFGFATLIVCYKSVKFELWLLCLLGILIFCVQFTISVFVGFYVERKDEGRRCQCKNENCCEKVNACMKFEAEKGKRRHKK